MCRNFKRWLLLIACLFIPPCSCYSSKTGVCEFAGVLVYAKIEHPAVHTNTIYNSSACMDFVKWWFIFMIVRFICALFFMLQFKTTYLWVRLHVWSFNRHSDDWLLLFSRCIKCIWGLCMHMHITYIRVPSVKIQGGPLKLKIYISKIWFAIFLIFRNQMNHLFLRVSNLCGSLMHIAVPLSGHELWDHALCWCICCEQIAWICHLSQEYHICEFVS